MKIYTKTGDEGFTGLLAGGRVAKSHVRLHAYGTVDELNAILGIVLSVTEEASLQSKLANVQGDLFTVGADLAAPLDKPKMLRTTADMTQRLEREIDAWDRQLPPLKNFILPGGKTAGAYLHLARTVCRRAERWIVALHELEAVNTEVLRYMNRLSDWLFVAARWSNKNDGFEERYWGKS